MFVLTHIDGKPVEDKILSIFPSQKIAEKSVEITHSGQKMVGMNAYISTCSLDKGDLYIVVQLPQENYTYYFKQAHMMNQADHL